MLKSKARHLRKLIELASASLPDDQAWDAPELFPRWETNTDYAVGDRVSFGAELYKCVQAHKSQDDWTPDKTPALWVLVDDPSVEWPEWRQPTGAQDAYQTGDKVSHNDKHWISTADNNVWEPGVYGWEEQ